MVCPNCQTRNIQNRVRCRQCNYPLFETTHEQRSVDYQKTSGDYLKTVDIQEPVLEKDRYAHNLLYHEPVEEMQPEREQVTVDRSITSVELKEERGPIAGFIWFGVSIVVAALLIYFLGIRSTERSSQMLFAQAEELYIQGSYFASRKIFQRFLDSFPESALAGMAYQRISNIDNGLIAEEEQRIYRQKRVELLIRKAQNAFDNQQLLKPEGENAFFFISEVILLDPGNGEALAIRDQIVSYYDAQGASAIAHGRYKAARTCYENILKLLPADPYALGELDRIQSILSAPQVQPAPTKSDPVERRPVSADLKEIKQQSEQEKRIEELRRKRQEYFDKLRAKDNSK